MSDHALRTTANLDSARCAPDVASDVSREWPLVGRVDEVELLERALADPDAVGIVLAGAAGSARRGWRLRWWHGRRRRDRQRPGCRRRNRRARSRSVRSHISFQRSWAPPPGRSTCRSWPATPSSAAHGQGGWCSASMTLTCSTLLRRSLLGHLLASRSCFAVVTMRSREPLPDAVVSPLEGRPLDRVELQPLSHDEVGDLIQAVLGGPVDGATLHRPQTTPNNCRQTGPPPGRPRTAFVPVRGPQHAPTAVDAHFTAPEPRLLLTSSDAAAPARHRPHLPLRAGMERAATHRAHRPLDAHPPS